MADLASLVDKVRSKNAGPFWLTIDIFCGSPEVFTDISGRLETAALAKAFRTEPGRIRRFDITALNVVKISLPRPAVQGTAADRDMHGASFARIASEIEV